MLNSVSVYDAEMRVLSVHAACWGPPVPGAGPRVCPAGWPAPARSHAFLGVEDTLPSHPDTASMGVTCSLCT